MTTINTVNGTVNADDLGRTLMHEHLIIGMPGWEADTAHPGPNREQIVATCIENIKQLQEIGVNSLIDPCPNDLGRDAGVMREVAAATGFNIICSTGLYYESGSAYWRAKTRMSSGVRYVSQLFIRELTEGIGDTGIKAGIIKVATTRGEITDYEKVIFEAAAIASSETGAPITTHTDDGVLGDQQQAFLVKHGVPANRIVIGHSCGTSDHDYHMRILKGGSYLGFDRFGIETDQTDENRVAALLAVLKSGAEAQVVVSHDSVWCWKGSQFPPSVLAKLQETWNPLRFFKVIIPMLKEGGATDEQIDKFLVDNPRRFFKGEALPPLR